MFDRLLALWGKKAVDEAKSQPCFLPEHNPSGFVYSQQRLNQPQWRILRSYLEQLEQEEIVIQFDGSFTLLWDAFYQLAQNPEHETSLSLLGVPPILPVIPSLVSQQGLSDNGFRVFIDSWRDRNTQSEVSLALDRANDGPLVVFQGSTYLLPGPCWQLIQAVGDLRQKQIAQPGQQTNMQGWAVIRKAGRAAQATMDGFLTKTRVVSPEHLRLRPVKSTFADEAVIRVIPEFEEQPGRWTDTFSTLPSVLDQYHIPDEQGGLTHVLINENVRKVLTTVRSFPYGGCILGNEAGDFVRNPIGFIGEAAQGVIDADEYEKDLAEAGIFFQEFRLQPLYRENRVDIESIDLILIPTTVSADIERVHFSTPRQMTPFVNELKVKRAAGLNVGFWKLYELDLRHFDDEQLHGIEQLLEHWITQERTQEENRALDLAEYGGRVIGIGQPERIVSPYLVKAQAEQWLEPEPFEEVTAELEKLSVAKVQRLIDQAVEHGSLLVELPDGKGQMPIEQARAYVERELQKKANEAAGAAGAHPARERNVLLIEQNIEESVFESNFSFSQLRKNSGRQARLPRRLLPSIRLREHQLEGVAWLQSLFACSPTHVSGCLLADDMGLGKTLQILTFIVEMFETDPLAAPAMIVAPVSLLDNWEAELSKFFDVTNLEVMKLYGAKLRAVKLPQTTVRTDKGTLTSCSLFRRDWLGKTKIVLTTYETMRDMEFSLARQPWSVMVCDEAQKIKNPIALVTSAAKAMQARFKVACTGTPVENTLVDLWSLFDFAQPGLLKGLNQFGKRYPCSSESAVGSGAAALDELRAVIEPLTLRRTKQDVARDLPEKIEDQDCQHLQMSALQRDLYQSLIARFRKGKKESEQAEEKAKGMVLSLLYKLKLVCSYPYLVQMDERLRLQSPKCAWLVQKLEQIRGRGTGEKVIIFTESINIQRELQCLIEDHFGFRPIIVNGSTSTNSASDQSRQKLIDFFQRIPGFGVIILSTVAVGFGVNIQAANHVIHFTRCWNPAKEDQATDRAYRIGQQKDVYVYYPIVRDASMTTFDVTLDSLLTRRRALAKDMLEAQREFGADDFQTLFDQPHG